MDGDWNDTQPIYRQLRDRVVAMILDGALKEGDALPSVRNVAAENRVNPLTVLKAYQQLVEEDLVEKRRGLGMYVKESVRAALIEAERRKFLETQWPDIYQTIHRLALSLDELMTAGGNGMDANTQERR
jgi:GntR family transcriptional regulator